MVQPPIACDASAPLDGLQTAWSTKACQVVGDDRPGGPVVEVEMRLGNPIDRPIHVRERYVDDVRMTSRYAEQRASAVSAERATAVFGRFVAGELVASALDRNLRAGNREPCDECGAVVPAAHAAMAVTAKERRQRHDEANRTTETGAADPFRSISAHLLSLATRGALVESAIKVTARRPRPSRNWSVRASCRSEGSTSAGRADA